MNLVEGLFLDLFIHGQKGQISANREQMRNYKPGLL